MICSETLLERPSVTNSQKYAYFDCITVDAVNSLTPLHITVQSASGVTEPSEWQIHTPRNVSEYRIFRPRTVKRKKKYYNNNIGEFEFEKVVEEVMINTFMK